MLGILSVVILHGAWTPLADPGFISQGRKSSVTILEPGIKEDSFRVDAVSPNGKLILGHSGLGLRTGVWLIDGNKVRAIPDLQPVQNLVAVSNDGTVLANFGPMGDPKTGGSVPVFHAALYREGELQFLNPDPAEPYNVGLEAFGFDDSGRVFGAVRRPGMAPDQIGTFEGGSWKEIVRTDHFMGALYTPVSGGYLVRGGYMEPVSKTRMSGTARAAVFREGKFDWLEVPAGYFGTQLRAWSPDGSTAAGMAGIQGKPPLSVIWRNGKVLSVLNQEGKGSFFAARSVNKDGTVIVGSSGLGEPGGALIWRENGGLQPLEQFLEEQKVKLPKGWSLLEASYVSADGTTLIGTAKKGGLQGKGKERPFVVRLTEDE